MKKNFTLLSDVQPDYDTHQMSARHFIECSGQLMYQPEDHTTLRRGELAEVNGYFPARIPYRVSAADQQGQTVALITHTADENESKMRPITTRA